MADFDTNATKNDLDCLMVRLGQKIEFLCQQLMDCTEQIKELIEEDQTLRGSLAKKEEEITGLKILVDKHSTTNQGLAAKITELDDDNVALRRKNKNQGVDINVQREQLALLQEVLENTKIELELLVVLAETSLEMEEEIDLAIYPQEEVGDSEKGRFKGAFICCGNDQWRSWNETNFLRLIEKLPQIDWGGDPLYVLKDQQRPTIPEGLDLVAILYRGLSHPDVLALKRIIKKPTEGVELVMHSNLGPMVTLIRQCLKNPHFSQAKESHRIGV